LSFLASKRRRTQFEIAKPQGEKNMAEAHGFPELDSNTFYSENFDGTLSTGQGILVGDPDVSPLVITAGTPFKLGARLILGGTLALILQALTGATAALALLTVNYFAEPLTNPPGGGAIALGSTTPSLQTNAGVIDAFNPSHVIYNETLTQITVPAGTLGTGTYRLTATHSFVGILKSFLPFSSYVPGPLIEIV
jgi:hypothetical protein